MIDKEDLLRFVLEFAKEKHIKFEVSATDIRQDTDEIVNYLRPDHPRQYVIDGLLLCETKMQELIAKHIPNTQLTKAKFPDLLKILSNNSFLDSSEIPPYKKLNQLRNKVAHQLSYQVRTKDADDIWNTLDKNQRTQIEQRYEINRSIAKEKPQVLIKAMILRLYTHVAYITEREDARADVKSFFDKYRS